MLQLCTPTQMRLLGYEGRAASIRGDLTYTDKKVDWTYRSFKKGERWFVRAHGQAAYASRLAELESQRKKCLLFEDEKGLWTYSGLRPLFQQQYGDEAANDYVLPAPKLIPWMNPPAHTPRYYQLDAKTALLQAAPLGPCGVEIGTGLGKSFIIELLLKDLGLQAVIMSPSVNIAHQLHRDLLRHFGPSKVGMFGDGKKQFNKLFTVGVAGSLRNVEIGTPAYKALSAAKIFIADESHMCPAETLSQVCFGLMASAPFRFFFSGTQMRADGLDLLLDAITGPIVYRMTVREGVDQGFLAQPIFRFIWCDSHVYDQNRNLYSSTDANDMTRAHVMYNPEVVAKAAEIANKAVSLMERPTVIMIEEYEQLQHLIPHLRFGFKFAHGTLTKEAKKFVPEEYWEDDPTDLVDRFNAGEFPILIGTSCITYGTDIQRVKMLVNLRGGKSEVELRQIVGRMTRKVPGKEDCVYVDFGIRNVEMLKRHATERIKILKDVYPSYSEIQL